MHFVTEHIISIRYINKLFLQRVINNRLSNKRSFKLSLELVQLVTLNLVTFHDHFNLELHRNVIYKIDVILYHLRSYLYKINKLSRK